MATDIAALAAQLQAALAGGQITKANELAAELATATAAAKPAGAPAAAVPGPKPTPAQLGEAFMRAIVAHLGNPADLRALFDQLYPAAPPAAAPAKV